MTESTKSRHVARYHAALDRLEDIDQEAVDDIDAYVWWLRDQVRAKRTQNALLRVEIAELGGDYNEHAFRNGGAPASQSKETP